MLQRFVAVSATISALVTKAGTSSQFIHFLYSSKLERKEYDEKELLQNGGTSVFPVWQHRMKPRGSSYPWFERERD